MTGNSPKTDALRAMREERFKEATADIPASIRRKPPADLHALARDLAAKAAAVRPARMPDPKPKPKDDVTKQRSRVRIQKMLAKKSGETAKVPLSGKAAMEFIRGGDQPRSAGAKPKDANQRRKPMTTKTKKTKSAKKTSKAKTAPASKSTEGVRPGTKLALVVEMLKRTEGCTTAEVLTATGWPAVSMPQQAKAAGLMLRKEKDGKVSRYWAA